MSNNNYNYILAYGSLRKGQYNFNRIKSLYPNNTTSVTFIKTVTMHGYKMYDLGQYPFAIYTGYNKDKIICDVLCVNDDVDRFIRNMELNASYIEFESYVGYKLNGITYKKTASIYLFKLTEEEAAQVGDLVENGDWVDYCYKVI